MERKTKKSNLNLILKKLELSNQDPRKTYLSFESKNKRNHYSLALETRRARDFWIGETYQAQINSSISPDFLGDKPEKMLIGAVSYEIKQLSYNGSIIYP